MQIRRRDVGGQWSTVAAITVVALVIGLVVTVPTVVGRSSTVAERVAAAVADVPVSVDALPTVQINGVVWNQAMAIDAKTVYAVGSFTTARPAGSAAGVKTVARHNFVAYDITTGVMTTFDADLNSTVRAVAVAPNGTVYVGGDFTTAKGVARNRIASFTPAGALIGTFKPTVNGTVRALAATDTSVYVGGSFTTAGGVARSRLAAFSAANGAVLNWNPAASDQVTAMVMAPDRSRVIVGGKFLTIGGKSAYGLGSISTATAAVLPFAANTVVRDGGTNGAITALSTDGTSIFGNGYAFGPSTANFEGTFSADPTTGNLNWLEDCHGDSYGTFVQAGVAYMVSHHHDCSRIAAFPQMLTPQRALAFTNVATQKVTKNFVKDYTSFEGRPAPTLLNWFPVIDQGTYTGQGQGAWSITGNSRYLTIGGEFPTVNGKAQQGLVRFALRTTAGVPHASGPVLTGTALSPTLSSPAAGSVKLTFPGNWDRDDRTLTWRIIRDGNTAAPVGSGGSTASFWKLPTLSVTDTGVPAGAHTYRVDWVDPSNNTSSSGNVSITVAGGGNAAPTAAADAFGRTTTGGFGSAEVGGAWTPTNAASALSVSNGAGQIALVKGVGAGAGLTSVAAQNVDTAVDFALSKAPTGASGYVYLDARTVGLASYRAKVTIAAGGAVALRLVRVVDAVETALGTTAPTGIGYTAGTALRVRLTVDGPTSAGGATTLRAKVWVRSTAEPSSWTVTTTDTNATLAGPGGVAVSGYLSGSVTNAPLTLSLDNLSATTS